MRQLQLLIKPASGFCNMRCQYCFYQDELQNRICPDSSMMSEDTAEMMIRQRFAEIDPCGSPSFALSFYLCPAQNVRNRPNSTDAYCVTYCPLEQKGETSILRSPYISVWFSLPRLCANHSVLCAQ